MPGSAPDGVSENPGIRFAAACVADAVACDTRCQVVGGAAGTGKTQVLVEKAAAAVDAGCDPARVLMVTPTSDAATVMHERLAACSPRAADIAPMTAFDVCVKILETPQAYRQTHRHARVLTQPERNMLMEDVRHAVGQGVCGTAGADDLRASLRRIGRAARSGRARDAWDLSSADAAVLHLIDSWLERHDAMLADEVPVIAWEVVASGALSRAGAQGEEHPDTEAGTAFDLVLIDDAQNLSRTALAAVIGLDAPTLVVAGNPNQDIRPFGDDVGACGSSVLDDIAEHTQATCLMLHEDDEHRTARPKALVAFADGLCRTRGMDGRFLAVPEQQEVLPVEQQGSVEAVKWRRPSSEFRGVAELVARLLHDRDDVAGGDVYLAVPNAYWARGLAAELKRRHLAADVVYGANPLAGDPRRLETSGMPAASALLALAADDRDAAAWRLWCGLGVPGCRAAAWYCLCRYAEARGRGVVEALQDVAAALEAQAEEPFEGAFDVARRYREGLDQVGRIAHKRGFALAKALVELPGAERMRALVEPVDGTEDARELSVRVARRSFAPGFAHNPRAVKVGSYAAIQGFSPRFVILTGAVVGAMPHLSSAAVRAAASPSVQTPDGVDADQARRRLASDRRVFYNAAGKAREMVVVSTDQTAPDDVAKRWGLDVRRHTRDRQSGERVAVLAHTPFIDEVREAAPSVMSGEQYLSLDRDHPLR